MAQNVPGVSVSAADSTNIRRFVNANQALNADFLALLPYSLVLQNNTPHTIVAYTLCLNFVDQTGHTGGHNRQYFSLDNKSNGMEVEPGGSRLITPIDAFNQVSKSGTAGTGPSPSAPSELFARLSAQKSITVSLDLLVFDTGQVFGKDEARTLSYLTGYVSGGQEAAELVEAALASRTPLASIAAQLENLARRTKNAADPEAMGRAGRSKELSVFAALGSLDRLLERVKSIRGMRTWSFYR